MESTAQSLWTGFDPVHFLKLPLPIAAREMADFGLNNCKSLILITVISPQSHASPKLQQVRSTRKAKPWRLKAACGPVRAGIRDTRSHLHCSRATRGYCSVPSLFPSVNATVCHPRSHRHHSPFLTRFHRKGKAWLDKSFSCLVIVSDTSVLTATAPLCGESHIKIREARARAG